MSRANSSKMFVKWIGIVIGAVATTHAVSAPLAPPPAERFEVTAIDTGMKQPIELAIAPDGRIFLIELHGDIKVYSPGSRAPALVGHIDCFAEQENGLLGIALDPNFSINHWVYSMYSPPGAAIQRISRFTIDNDKLDPASEKTVLEFATQRQECCHHAGSLAFGPDGCLFISSGDNTNPGGDSGGFAPIDWRPNRGPWDAAKSAGNTNDLRGKVLRIKPTPEGGYTIPAGNLFPAGTDKTRGEIYAMGCRNPWKMSVDSKNGIVYWGEVGPDVRGEEPNRGPRGYDEINQARKAGNFGWPFVIADNKFYRPFDYATKQPGEWIDPKAPVNDSPNNTGLRTLPPATPAMIWYPYDGSKEFPEVGAGGRTACAGPVFYFDRSAKHPSTLPEYFDHCLFIYDWERNWIKAVRLNKDDRVESIEPFLSHLSFKRPVDIKIGPKGEMYLLEYGGSWGVNADSKLSRIEFFAGNRAPLAVATATNSVGQAPLKVTLSSAGSIDKDGDKIKFEWRRRSGGDVVSTEPHPTLTFDQPGIFTVELSVIDSTGETGVVQVPVRVGNTIPIVTFDSPRDGQFYDPTKPLSVQVSGSDPEDGSVDFVQLNLNYDVRTADGHATSEAPVVQLMRSSDCMNCHAVNNKILGPAFLDIANKYRKEPKAIDASVERVMKGSSGVWGPVPMLPHAQHTPEQVREMVRWVYALQPPAATVSLPTEAATPVTLPVAPAGQPRGALLLQASYTDLGGGLVGQLTGTASISLRPYQIEADAFDALSGNVLMATKDDGGKMIGQIRNGSHVVNRNINLDGIERIECRVGAEYAGTKMEFHADSPTGPLLGELEVKPTGGWEKFENISTNLKNPGKPSDLYVVFRNNAHGEGLMNLRWIEFHPTQKAP